MTSGPWPGPRGLPAEMASLKCTVLDQSHHPSTLPKVPWAHCSISHPDRACPSPWASAQQSPLAPGPLGPSPAPLPDAVLPVPSQPGARRQPPPRAPWGPAGAGSAPATAEPSENADSQDHQGHRLWHLNLDEPWVLRTRLGPFATV